MYIAVTDGGAPANCGTPDLNLFLSSAELLGPAMVIFLVISMVRTPQLYRGFVVVGQYSLVFVALQMEDRSAIMLQQPG